MLGPFLGPSHAILCMFLNAIDAVKKASIQKMIISMLGRLQVHQRRPDSPMYDRNVSQSSSKVGHIWDEATRPLLWPKLLH